MREKLAVLACYREGINAHLTAAIALAEESPSGLLMPNQSLLYAGRVHACTSSPRWCISRASCGRPVRHAGCRRLRRPGHRPWLDKFYSINESWAAEDRRKLLAFARPAELRLRRAQLTFQLFAQSPPFAHLNAVYMNFDFSGPLEFVKKSAGLSDRVT